MSRRSDFDFTPKGPVKELLADPPDRAATRAYAEGFSWDATTEGQIELFNEILA